jgi:N-formylglutamate amidohydrolase
MTRPVSPSAAAEPPLGEAPELAEPLRVTDPAVLESPLVLSSPHSGHVYPASFLAMSRLDSTALRRSEDMYVDALMAPSAKGLPLVCARFPRAFLDVNREPYELDPRMFEGRLPPQANTRSMRVAGGLGTIARIVGESQEIYAHRLPVAAALARIDALYRPYHRMLRGMLGRAMDTFGLAVLVDCHSMPSMTAATGITERIKADIVLGDRHGTSCDPLLVETLEAALRRAGYAVHRNKPYAGGYITEYYGRPASRMHAIQIEINRALYMDEQTFARRPAFERLSADLARAIDGLGAAALSLPRYRAAAE